MITTRQILQRSALVAIGLLALAGSPALAQNYVFSDLGTVTGGNEGFLAYRVNSHGAIAGNQNVPLPDGHGGVFLGSFPVVLNGNTLSQLDPLPGLIEPASTSWTFNDAGQSAGSSGNADLATSSPVRWDGTTPVPLETLGFGGESSAYHINNQAQLVGQSWTGESLHAVRWDGTAITDLGTLGGTSSSADSISESGDIVVGRAQTTNDEAEHAVYWDSLGIHDLGTLGGTDSYSLILNDTHQIIGASQLSGDDVSHAALWNGLGAPPVDLGSLGGDSIAWFINNAGTIVGESAMADGTTHATLWENGLLIDLNDYLPTELRAGGWYLGSAQAINEHGAIVGWLNNIDPTNTAGASFLLTPVPVPAAVWLFGSGLAGLVGVLRRRQSKV
ncbi:MAG: hypothetical protein IPP12_09825 [Nitrospira sp.]|nr:hypothetical protein [Nitrospira sp.]